MSIRTALLATSLLAAGQMSGTAHAALQGRDLDGNLATFEAYYDTVLDITWLADAAMSDTVTWEEAVAWAANLSFTDGVNVYDNWRLPSTTDTGAPGCDFANSGTDCGYNVDTASSEMAHLYFVTLGNQSYFTSAGVDSGAYIGGTNPDSTLDNTGPFINLQSYGYWSGTEYASYTPAAWWFITSSGRQEMRGKGDTWYALAVSPGSIGLVPEAETHALMLAGLGLIGWRLRRRG